MPRKHQDQQASFWSHVDRSGGPEACWPWLLCVDDRGYGRVAWVEDGTRVKLRAHQVAFLCTHGWRPRGQGQGAVRHTCDNPPCCNPSHLLPGTLTDNVRDAIERGRFVPPPRASGADHPRFRLTDEVRSDIHRQRAAGASIAAIARATTLGWTTVKRAIADA